MYEIKQLAEEIKKEISNQPDKIEISNQSSFNNLEQLKKVIN